MVLVGKVGFTKIYHAAYSYVLLTQYIMFTSLLLRLKPFRDLRTVSLTAQLKGAAK